MHAVSVLIQIYFLKNQHTSLAMKLLISLLLITATLCNVIDVNSNEELWHWLCNGTINDSSQILFTKASYTLASPGFCIIQSVNNITLRSVTGHSSIYCSPKKKNGFEFINITNITVAGIDFKGCAWIYCNGRGSSTDQ